MSEPSLDDVLSGEAPVSEDQDEPKTDEVEGEPEEDTGKGEDSEPPSDEDKAEEEPKDDEPKQTEVPITALLDEREKRQKLERELDQLRSSQPKEPEQKVDPLEDPEGFQAQIDQQLRAATFAIERKFMSKLHDDWPQAEEWINSQLGENVALQAKLQNSENILEDAYAMYQQHLKLEALEDADAMEARLRAEIEAKVRAEMGEQAKGDTEKAQTVDKAVSKPSVVTTGTSQSTAYQGEQTLEDIIGADFASRPK